MKYCIDCKKYLPDEMFYKDNSRPDNKSRYCIEHTKERVLRTKKKKELNNHSLKVFFGWGAE